MTRDDLIALSHEALAEITNRGLVKRALAATDLPLIVTEDDGTIAGTVADGTVTRIPPAGVAAASCTCGATSVCRHALMTVLAYQSARTAAPVANVWSPGAFTDDDVEALIGSRAMAAARKRRDAGYGADVTPASTTEPVPQVRLPACTVRFLVPGELGYARSDATGAAGAESIALAVWAFRAYDQLGTADGPALVHVGARAATVATALSGAARLATAILLDGAVHTGTGQATAFAQVQRDLDGQRLRWPLLALEDLAAELTAYRDRHASYQAERLAELIAEIHARHRAVTNNGASPPSHVLGTEEAADTPLRRATLTALGARIRTGPDEQTADVYLADPAAGLVFVLRQAWPVTDETPLPGAVLAQRRAGPATIGALAAGHVVTESAVRTASRRIRLASKGIGKSTVTPSAGRWEALPPGLLIRDLAAYAVVLDRLPPRLLRPRVDAEAIRVAEVAAVRDIAYARGDQRLTATIEDGTGGTATVSAVHRAESPAALDVLANALTGAEPPRFISGAIHRSRHGLVIDPVAFTSAGRVVVPDLEESDGTVAMPAGSHTPTSPGDAAIDGALGLLADAAHRGLRHLPPTFTARARDAGAALSDQGYGRAGASLHEFAAALGPDPGDAAAEAWAGAQIRLLVIAERR